MREIWPAHVCFVSKHRQWDDNDMKQMILKNKSENSEKKQKSNNEKIGWKKMCRRN